MKFQERCNCQTNHHIYDHPETPFVVGPYNEKRIHECCKASNDDEGGRDLEEGPDCGGWTECGAI